MRIFKSTLRILLLFLSVGLVSFLILNVLGRIAKEVENGDFYFYYYSFEIIWQHKNPILLYDRDYLLKWLFAQGAPNKMGFFGYPPPFSVLLSWMASWKINIASQLWANLSNFLFIIGCFLYSFIAYKGKKFEIRVLLLCIPFLTFGFFIDGFYGQANRVLFFLLSLTFFLFYEKKKPWLAGIPLAIAIVFKVLPVIVLFFLFFLRKEWKICLSTLFSTIFLTLVTVKVVGGSIIFDFFLTHSRRLIKQTIQFAGAPWNSSLHGVLQSYGFPIELADKQFFLLVSLLIIFLCFFFLKYRGDDNGDINLAILAMLLIPPVFESHYILYSTFIFMSLFGNFIERIPSSTWKSIPLLTIQLGITLYAFKLSMVGPTGISYFIILILLFLLSLSMYKEPNNLYLNSYNK